jgi:acyl-CoA hydrolase
MNGGPRSYSDVETLVEDTLNTVGPRINLGTPLGLGKANHLVNEFFRRAKEDSKIKLHIFTALSLDRPQWKGEFERRFLEPLSERLFGGYPSLAYVDFVRRGKLPDNIRVSEFYFQPGSFLDSPLAQQSYMSSNYTHAVRDIREAGINVLAQLVSKEEQDGVVRYSLSCNPDLTLDLVPPVREAKRRGGKIALLAQVNRNLPFMYGDAAVSADYFDALVDDAKYQFPLFGTPNRPVDKAEYLIALHVTPLIKDGGTIQVGIGALEDAVTYLLKLRHDQNDLYREMLTEAGILERFGGTIERIGGTNRFERGLYGSSEMLVDGFLELYRSGILRRKVYQDAALQRLLNDNHITEEVTPAKIDLLVESGTISGEVRDACLQALRKGGHVAHACFFLGPQKFYDNLRQLSPVDRKQICMTAISYVNQLFGNEELKRLQRQAARFINTGLIVTLTGAVASDGLEDGRVLSGVGGQYNFVAMAHELEDGRSIIMIRSTKEQDGKTLSNIRWNYGHITIPRHLRDIVVTEYGIAELRGRSDEEVVAALLEIADSRFQDRLLSEAKRAGKIRQNYSIPDYARNNRPEHLEKILASYRKRGLFPQFPFGTDLTEEENTLRKALLILKQMSEEHKLRVPQLAHLRKTLMIPDQADPYLVRMDLNQPGNVKESFMQRALVYALASIDAI